jgi:peptide/nickel transport system permease protein
MQVRDYVIRRLIKLPFVIIAVTIGVFLLSRIGGSPIAIYIEHEMSPDEIDALEERYGLNDPLPVQYLHWIWGVLRGDLGWSGVSVAPVSQVLPSRFIATMELATLGALIAIALGIGLGTFAGARHNKISDHLTRVFTVTGASLPLFWFALLMLILFYLIIPVVPLGRFDEAIYASINHYTGFYSLDALLNFDPRAFLDAIKHLALPAFVLGFEGMAVTARMMRSSLVEEMTEDYVDSAVGDQAARSPQRPHPDRHGHRHGLGGAVAGFGGGGERVPVARPRPVGHRRRPPRRQSHDHGLRSRHRCRVPGRQPRRRRHLRLPRPEGHPRSGQLGGRTR